MKHGSIMRRVVVRLAVLLGVIFVLAVAAFAAWSSTPMGPLPEAEQALAGDERVRVTHDRWLVFEPAAGQPNTALIFYPGARVDYRSYAPLAREIAGQGYRVVIVPMPLNMAVFGSNRASDVIAASPEIEHWAIGGHSLGGSIAALFAAQHPGLLQGLVLLASYPGGNSSLAGSEIRAVSIYGTQDQLTTLSMVETSRPLLPADTRYVAIDGGNHAQFGWYGVQGGDGQATITPQAQQEQVVAAAVALLEELRGE